MRLTTSVNSARRTANEAAYATRFARTTRSTGGSDASVWRLRISLTRRRKRLRATAVNWKRGTTIPVRGWPADGRSEEHTSELQSRGHLVCRLLLEKKKKQQVTG